MADMNIRNVPDVTLGTWKKRAIDTGVTLREWVITGLNECAVGVKPAGLTAEEREIISQAELRMAEKRKVVQVAVPEMKRAMEDRGLLAFRGKYGREPANEAELEGFRKKGW